MIRWNAVQLLTKRLWLNITGISIAVSAASFLNTPAISQTVFSSTVNRSTTSFEASMIAELNRARTNPTAYANWLDTLRSRYSDRILNLPEEGRVLTIEGVAALDDAIAFLRQQSPLPPLQQSAGMSQGARDRLLQSPHTPPPTLGDRLRRYGTWEGRLAEVITFPNRTAITKVMLLILNDGNPNRPLRRQIFSPEFRYVGAACSPHRERTCVLNYVTNYQEQGEAIASNSATPISSAILAAPATVAPQPTQTATTPAAQMSSVAGNSSSHRASPHPVAIPNAAVRSGRTHAPASTSQTPGVSSDWSSRIPTVMVAIAHTPYLRNLESATYLSLLEREIIAETNRLRVNPSAYADELEHLLQYYDGKLLRMPGLPPYETVEGTVPVREAIATLRRTRPLQVLAPSQGMSRGAKDHAMDLAAHNASGHYGSDGSTHAVRISRYGTWQNSSENVSLSPFESARWHILQLLIDDGVPGRGHRRALLKPEYRITGVGCSSHPAFASVCVMTYAEQYTERQ